MTSVEELTLADDAGESLHLTVTGLDRLAFDQLVEDHAPRPGEDLLWNDATFPPELIAACTGRSLAWAEHFWHASEVDEAEDVFEVCLRQSGPGLWTWATWRLQRDPRVRLELRLCNKAGISHSHFLGGPRVWTERDRDLALAALELDLDRCPGCGVAREDMQDPDAAEIVQDSCVHCELKAHMWNAIPEAERDRVHLMVVPARRA